MNAAECFPIIGPLLGHKKPPLSAAWSTCELKLTNELYQQLFHQLLATPRFRFDRFVGEQAAVHNVEGHRVSNRMVLGLVVTVVMAEFARREALEGQFWTAIARRFEAAEFYTRLFTSVGQPTTLCRELLEETARFFHLRHIYGHEGHKEWYSSLVLQFGFTRRGFQRRLAEWLASQQSTLAVRMLLFDQGLRSPTFHRLWDALWTYRRGNKTVEQARQVLAESTWVLPEWHEELLKAARERRELDQLDVPVDWEESDDDTQVFLSEPKLIWEIPGEPYLQSSLVRLAELDLIAPEYTVRVGDVALARLLRQPDGSYHAGNRGEVHLPFSAGCMRVDLVGPLGDVVATQDLETSDPWAEASLYDATTGVRVRDDGRAVLIQSHRYALLVAEDLEVVPTPIAEQRRPGCGFKAVALPPYTSGSVQVALAGETLCEWSIVPRQEVDSSGVVLRWGDRFDDGHAGVGYVHLHLPNDWTLRRARRDFRTLAFTEVANRQFKSEAFTISPDDHVRDVRIELHLRFRDRLVRKCCRLPVPGVGVLWQKRGEQEFVAFEAARPLYTHSAQQDRFLFRLNLPRGLSNPRDVALYYHEHVLMEGAFFHRRLGQSPIHLGRLHGYGQRLVVMRNGFNADETVLEVSESVIDTGIVHRLREKEDEPKALELRQAIYPTAEHQLVVVTGGLSLQTFPCELVDGTKNHRLCLPADMPSEGYVAIGVLYHGIRLGSVWNHPEARRLREIASLGDEQALRAARITRILKLPLLSGNYATFSLDLVLQRLPAFVGAWLDEGPIEIDGVKLQSPGLDDAAAYAFAELMRLDPLQLDDDHVCTLVETYGDSDPLGNPEEALAKVTLTLARLSPILAATVARRWVSSHARYFKRGVCPNTVLAALRDRLLGGLSVERLLEQVSATAKADPNFISRHLQTRLIPNWKSNIRALQNELPFRVLLTRAFLEGL